MKKIRLVHYLAFGSGNAGLSIVNIAVQTWLLYFFAPSEGRVLIPASWVGMIWLSGRIIDALTDPIIGGMSDRCGSKHGKRLPFLAAAAIPLPIITFALFYEPLYAGGLYSRAVILTVLLGLFYLLFTIYGAPYYGLIPDLTSNRGERVNLATSSAVFNLAGTGIAMILTGYLIKSFSEDPSKFSSSAYVPSMGIISIAGAIFLSACVIGLYPMRKRSSGTPSGDGLIKSITMVFKNKPFVVYLFGMNIFWGGFVIINISIPYYITVLMKKDIGFSSIALGAAFGTALLMFPVINFAARRYGNRNTIITCSLTMAAALTMIALLPLRPFGIDPARLGLSIMAFSGIPIAGLFTVPNAMVANLSDFKTSDGVKPGEAIYFGVQGVVLKTVVGLVTAGTGLIYDVFGSTLDKPAGVLMTGPIGGALALGAALTFIFLYPDDRSA